MSLPGRFLSLGGQRVFYSRSGPRTSGHSPVVFLHGYLVSHWAWRRVLPQIAVTHDVIAFDFPGFGESDRPAPTEYGYDAAAFSETVIAVLDALEIDRASLVGHSMGGGIALYTTARQPERVDRLMVVDPLCFPFNIPVEGKLLLLPYVGASIMRTVYSRPVIRHYMTRHVYRDPTLVSDEWVDYIW